MPTQDGRVTSTDSQAEKPLGIFTDYPPKAPRPTLSEIFTPLVHTENMIMSQLLVEVRELREELKQMRIDRMNTEIRQLSGLGLVK